MTELELLQGLVFTLKDTIAAKMRTRRSIQRDLDEVESQIISAKEDLRKAEEDLDKYNRTKVLTNVDTDLRRQDIEGFRERLPGVMAKEANKELDAFKKKIDSAFAKRKVQGNGNVACDENPVEAAGKETHS